MIELKEGMTIYRESRFGNSLYKGEVIRTTKTQAIAKLQNGLEYRFNKMQNSSYFYEKGNYNYYRDCYHVSTPELDERYKIQFLVLEYKKIDPEKLTSKQLNDIINISKRKQ
jgi:hypothetical protein